MALRVRLPGSKDWANTSYWSGAAVPVNGDDVRIYEGADQIDTNLPATSLNLASFQTGPDFRGGIGSETAALNIGVTGDTILRHRHAPGRFTRMGGGTNPIVKLRWFGAGDIALGAGTITHLGAGGSGVLRVGQSAVVTALVCDNPEQVVDLLSNATRANLMQAIAGTIQTRRGAKILEAIGNPDTGKGVAILLDNADVSDTSNTGLARLLGGVIDIRSNAAGTPNAAQIDGDLEALAGVLLGENNPFGNIVIAGDLTTTAAARVQRQWGNGTLTVSGSQLETAGPPGDLYP